MSQPSLRIIHDERHMPPADFRFDVWNPTTGAYEAMDGFSDAMDRVQRLAHDVRELWIAKDAALDHLASPPAPDLGAEFAELRVTAQAQRHYDIRSFDQPEWTHFRGYISQAAEQICAEVGYVLAPSLVPAPPPSRLQAKSA